MISLPIQSCDAAGGRHQLRVTDHPTGMVEIADDERVRIILTPGGALALAVQLIKRAEPQIETAKVVGLFSAHY